MLITKASGEQEEFSEEKLLQSITRAGIAADLRGRVLAHIKSKLYPKIKTSEIYRHILEFLDQPHTRYHKAKYSLKQSLMDLGPTGYPFEDFLARIFSLLGYQATTRSIIMGKCITHEVDIIAEKQNLPASRLMVEAKFHNTLGIKTDVQVALYTKARFEDVKQKNNLQTVYLVTNTKMTTDAIAYANCVGMQLMSWDYPKGNSLRDLIEKFQLHPITCLSSLSKAQKQTLLSQGIVFCQDIYRNYTVLDAFALNAKQKQEIIEESALVCSISH